ncbi:MAG: hypothetical protein IRY94_04700 [Rhodospirillaceae bacterium]|nr:hypothetical protein [Rhodospirillaceae bacterium]
MRWLLWFVGLCAALIVVGLGVLWAGSGFESLGVSGSILAALILTVVFVSALGVGLMALMFHSSRSGQDETVYHHQEPSLRDPSPGEPPD